MQILIQATQLILSLSILIVFHELGHFIPSKLFKTRVEKFYLFFDPWFSLFKIKKGDTEYGIGWIPLGGYVKISGMIDESMDKEQMKLPAQPWEFRAKPAWQRLIIMIGGVSVNVILAIVIYICMLAYWGEDYMPVRNMKYGITTDSLARKVGLHDGDKIISVNGQKINNFNEISAELLFNDPKNIKVDRGGNEIDIPIDIKLIAGLVKAEKANFIGISYPVEIEDFSKDSDAKKAGLLKGDVIKFIDSIPTPHIVKLREVLEKNKNKTVSVIIERKGENKAISVKVNKDGYLGFVPASYNKFLKIETKQYSFFEAIPAGTLKAFKSTIDYFKQFKLIFSKEVKGYESVGGFIKIGSIFTPTWDWQHFWSITAFISIILAIMNILPIPALDGGHVLFLLYEIITRRKPNEKFMEYAQIGGMVILFALLLLANGNDVYKLLFK